MAVVDVGRRIQDRRKALGLNQDQLAEMASLNRVTVAKYESGKVEPGAQALSRIADALETTTDALLGRDPDVQPEPGDEIWELREQLRRSPEFRLLYDAAQKATPDQLRAAAAVLKALRPNDEDVQVD